MSAEDTPVASIVQVGADAPVGDVVVAVAVITARVSSRITITSAQKLDDRIAAEVTDNRNGSCLSIIESTPATGSGSMNFTLAGLPTSREGLLGILYDTYSQLADFSVAVGFCPHTAADMFRRLASAKETLFRLVRKKYAEIPVFMPDISKLIDEKQLRWSDGVPRFPSPVESISCDLASSSDGGAMRALFATTVAEAIAASVRTARIYDLDETYPSLCLSSNLGYGCEQLYKGFMRFQLPMTEKGLRGDLTSTWIAKVEHDNPPKEGTAKTRALKSAVASTAVGRDASGRATMDFDKDRAIQMADELNLELVNNTQRGLRWSQWTKDFVRSVYDRLQSGRRLTGRQMLVLHQVHEKKGW